MCMKKMMEIKSGEFEITLINLPNEKKSNRIFGNESEYWFAHCQKFISNFVFCVLSNLQGPLY